MKIDKKKLIEIIYEWARGMEMTDKFGDIQLQYDCDDVGLLIDEIEETQRKWLKKYNEMS